MLSAILKKGIGRKKSVLFFSMIVSFLISVFTPKIVSTLPGNSSYGGGAAGYGGTLMKTTAKKLIFICLLVFMLLVFVPSTAVADTVTLPVEAYNYTNNSNGTVTIKCINATWYANEFGSNITPADLNLVIPDEIDGKKVVAIGIRAFTKNYGSENGWPTGRRSYDVVSVDFSQTTALEEIGDSAFASQTNLTSISLPNTVTKVGNSSFYGLKEITLSNNLTYIGTSAFSSSGFVDSTFVRVNGGDPNAIFELPNTIETIGERAFYNFFPNSTGELSFKIPASVTTIGRQAFYNANLLNGTIITVEGSGSYSGFNATAFNITGSTTSATNALAIIFPSMEDCNNFSSKSGIGNFKNSCTYVVDVNFFDQSSNPLLSEEKVNNKSIKLVKNSYGVWGTDDTYTLPSTTGFTAENGHAPNWVYEGTVIPVTINDKIAITGTFVNVVPGMSPIDPVSVKGTVNGVVVTEGSKTPGWHSFDLSVPDVYSPAPTIGVEITHPLYSSDNSSTDSSGGYVIFYTKWFDIKGSTEGPRSYPTAEYPFKYYNTTDHSISIRSASDLRNGIGDRYEIIIYGLYVNGSNSSDRTKFYQSMSSEISFNGVNNSNITDSTTFTLLVGNYVPITITYDLSGGNVSGSGSDIVWSDVTASTLGGHGTVPVPTKDGYILTGWVDNTSTSTVIAPGDMADEAVTVTKTYTAQWQIDITFDLNGGNVGGDTSAIVRENVTYGALLNTINIPAPTRDGYVLTGWKDNTTNAIITPDANGIQIIGTKTYTAQWAPKPEIVSVSPEGDNGGSGYPITTNTVTIVFDIEMNTSHFGTVVLDNGAILANGVWSNGNQTITYDLSNLTYSKTYSYSVSGFKSSDEAVMDASMDEYNFTTEAAPSEPQIVSVSPNGTGILVSSNLVTIVFDREMNITHFGTVTLDNGAILENGAWNADKKTLNYTLSNLTYSTTYNFTIKDFNSSSDVVMVNSIDEHDFTTEAAPKPQISSVSPTGTGISVTSSLVTIVFDMEMNTSHFGTVVLDNGAILENGAWNADKKTLNYTLSNLTYSTTYNYSISGFKSAYDVEMDSSINVYDFTTIDRPSITVVAPVGDNSGSGFPITTDKVSVTFNKEMNASSNHPGTVTLDNGAVLTSGVWSNGNQTITYDLSNLTYSKTYNYTIRDFESVEGGAISDSINVYDFTTEAAPKPQISSVSPTGTGISVTSSLVTIVFDMEMNITHFGTVVLDNGAILENGAWNADKKTLNYTLSNLTYSETYNYSISGFKSAYDVEMDSSINVYDFTTIDRPSITVVAPVGDNSGSGFPITTDKVSVTFNKEMNASSNHPGTVTLDNGAVLTSGVWSNGNQTITYDLSNLTYSKTYNYTIRDFESVEGGAISDSINVYDFTTEAAPKPQISSVSPTGTGISVTSSLVTIVFDMEMNITHFGTVVLDNGAILENGDWNADKKTLNYTLSNLTYSETYNYSISGFKSKYDAEMDSSINVYDFTTIDRPSITAVTPVGDNSGSGFPITTDKVSVTFNKEMNASSNHPGTVTLDNGAVLANGVWSNGNQTITYDLSNLTYSKTYNYTIKDFESVEGGVISDSINVYDFTTEAAPKPEIDTITPEGDNGGSGHSITTNTVTIVFDMEMNTSQLGAITLDNGAILTGGTWNADKKTLNYTLSNLTYLETYNYSISGFKSKYDAEMDLNTTYWFETEPDTHKPYIVKVIPNGTGISVTTDKVLITFNEKMNQVVTGTVELDNSVVLDVPGIWLNDTTIEYTISSDLDYSTTYNYTIKDFEDSAGNKMDDSINVFWFTTVNKGGSSGGGGGSGGGTVVDDQEEPEEDSGSGGSDDSGQGGSQMGGFEEDEEVQPVIILTFMIAIAFFCYRMNMEKRDDEDEIILRQAHNLF
ncbi:hypothetical protein MmiHf6_11420 [Methanimicrococcus hongohii]|uniref:Fibronectin type-III domain-containing protein n=1 Tax=Methanimicrococcus hongohii TaxID=3028295 RepID=A0AA96V9D3_9EURY|nr:leucine-rich repeat protein [Methanimicrococcus sp. Hf6]WNY23821.1 hypothetical protein MmiHf6_11420 [Methanimicrococcus sp. Hf6]